jgi:hypothetical protein
MRNRIIAVIANVCRHAQRGDWHEQVLSRIASCVLLQHAPKLLDDGTLMIWDVRLDRVCQRPRSCERGRKGFSMRAASLLTSPLHPLIGRPVSRPFLASSNVVLSMLQDYTDYTHLC